MAPNMARLRLEKALQQVEPITGAANLVEILTGPEERELIMAIEVLQEIETRLFKDPDYAKTHRT